MKGLYVALAIAVVVTVRVVLFRARRRRRAPSQGGSAEPSGPSQRSGLAAVFGALEHSLGDVGLVAGREIRERVRGRIFRVGTIIMLGGVAAAVVIPTLHKSSGPTIQRIGVVGGLAPDARHIVLSAGQANQDSVKFVVEASVATAKADLRSDKVDMSVVDSRELLLEQSATASDSPADPGLVTAVADYLGVLQAYRGVGLTAAQVEHVIGAKPVPVHVLAPSSKSSTRATSIIGLVLLFFMLTQYCTWILIGVMQEKSSRVVEVLLAVVKPLQLLGGKVLGIGTVALGQATLIVGFALALGAGVGSDLLKGTAPLALLSELLWLVLGYAFYCWVYAAAGSTAERQDQVQTLALPLSLPMLFGYIYSVTVASTGHTSLFFKVLAYFPPTAPFCMSVLVGLRQVSWWEFVASVLITMVATVGVALFAARIYRRAVLRTGGRVRLGELVSRPAR